MWRLLICFRPIHQPMIIGDPVFLRSKTIPQKIENLFRPHTICQTNNPPPRLQTNAAEARYPKGAKKTMEKESNDLGKRSEFRENQNCAPPPPSRKKWRSLANGDNYHMLKSLSIGGDDSKSSQPNNWRKKKFLRGGGGDGCGRKGGGGGGYCHKMQRTTKDV